MLKTALLLVLFAVPLWAGCIAELTLSPKQIFAKRSPHDFGNFDYPESDHTLTTVAYAIFGQKRYSAAGQIRWQTQRTRAIETDFLAAVASGRAELQIQISAWEALDVARRVEHLVGGEYLDAKFFDHALKEGDELYAYEGDLVRLRPSDGSVFVLPRQLQHYCAEFMTGVSIFKLKRHWLTQNFYPHFPQYAPLEKFIADDYSSWFETAQGWQLLLQSAVTRTDGFVDFQIEFRDTETLIAIRPRWEARKDDYFTAMWKRTDEYLRELASTDPETEIGQLASAYVKDQTLVIPAAETVEFLKTVFQALSRN
ncbi:hypothetical protein K2X33_04455 [bacterium]|nr:hypothetical protein [bacterium]